MTTQLPANFPEHASTERHNMPVVVRDGPVDCYAYIYFEMKTTYNINASHVCPVDPTIRLLPA